MAVVLGAGSVVFGIGPVIAPRWFARQVGIPVENDPRLQAVVRSVGVRDAVIGTGLARTAARGGDYRGWLLARLASDWGDAAAIGLAVGSGSRDRRFLRLGGIAIAAGLFGNLVYWLALRRG
jgi:hypothetical protein